MSESPLPKRPSDGFNDRNKSIKYYVDFLTDGKRVTKVYTQNEKSIRILSFGSNPETELELDLVNIRHIVHEHAKTAKGFMHIVPTYGAEAIKIWTFQKFHILDSLKRHIIYSVQDIQYYDEKRLSELPRRWFHTIPRDYIKVVDIPDILSQLINFDDNQILLTEYVLRLQKNHNVKEDLVMMDKSMYLFKNNELKRRILYKSINVVLISEKEMGFVIPEESDLHLFSQNSQEVIQILNLLRITVKDGKLDALRCVTNKSQKEKLLNPKDKVFVRHMLNSSKMEDVIHGMQYARMQHMEHEKVYKKKLTEILEYKESIHIVEKWNYYESEYDMPRMKKYLDRSKSNPFLRDKFYKEKLAIYEKYEADPFNENYLNIYLNKCRKYFDYRTIKSYFSEDNDNLIDSISPLLWINLKKQAKEMLSEIELFKEKITFQPIADDCFIEIREQGLHEKRINKFKLTFDAFDKLGYNIMSRTFHIDQSKYTISIKALQEWCRSQQTHFVYCLELPEQETRSPIISFQILRMDEAIYSYIYELTTSRVILGVISQEVLLSPPKTVVSWIDFMAEGSVDTIWNGKYKDDPPKWKFRPFAKKIQNQIDSDTIRQSLGITHPYSHFVVTLTEMTHKNQNPIIMVEYGEIKYKIMKRDMKTNFRFDFGSSLSTFVLSIWDTVGEFLGEVRIKAEDIHYIDGWYQFQSNPDQNVIAIGDIHLGFEIFM